MDLRIVSYNCMWVYSYLNIKKLKEKTPPCPGGVPQLSGGNGSMFLSHIIVSLSPPQSRQKDTKKRQNWHFEDLTLTTLNPFLQS